MGISQGGNFVYPDRAFDALFLEGNLFMSNQLITAASFVPRSVDHPTAWVGHLPFASWLVEAVKPSILVELGTHTGNSYFSFCQAIQAAKLVTQCFAVDTWQGDEHAGQYSEAIYEKVRQHNADHYSDFSQLLRMTFDRAISQFEDKAINLLHIDGFHTYEAVKHDFETWLPKLAPGAIVLFHDTNVHRDDFGVWRYWDEIRKKYPNHFNFLHSHGLGVLQIANQNSPGLEWIGVPNNVSMNTFIQYFSTLGVVQTERFATQQLLHDLDKYQQTLEKCQQTLVHRDAEIVYLRQLVTPWKELTIRGMKKIYRTVRK